MKFSKTRIAALAFAALASSAALAQEVTLRLHQMLPAQATIPSKAIVPWIKKVETESNGRIKIQLFNAMQMGGTPPQLFDQARDGVADITWTVLGYTPGRFIKTEVFELPFMTGNGAGAAEASSRALLGIRAAERDGRVQGRCSCSRAHHGPGLFTPRNPSSA
jgi:TRAP-type C4-dicarboxylate transport system substrate-binding protein